MPLYNATEYVRQAIESVLAQTCPDFELIISDNQSTDGTWEICEEYAGKDPRIILHRQAENIGGFANFCFVLEKARAEMYTWVAHDDLRTSNTLEELAALLDSAPTAGLAVCRTIRIDPTGAELDGQAFPDIDGLGPHAKLKALLSAAQKGTWFYGLYRTSDLRREWGRWSREDQSWGTDYLMVLSLLFNDQVVGTNAATFYQRITGKSEGSYAPSQFSQSAGFLWEMLRKTWVIARGSQPRKSRVIGSVGLFSLYLACAFYYFKLFLSRTPLRPALFKLWRMLKRCGGGVPKVVHLS